MISALETHEEDWYWCNPGEVMIEVEFLQDITDDGLFQKPSKWWSRYNRIKNEGFMHDEAAVIADGALDGVNL